MIEVNVRKQQGEFSLLAELEDSGFICLAGRNGSGKTSLLKAIAGLLQVDDGYVRIGGIDVTRLPMDKRRVIMVTPNSFFPHLDVDSHITWGARLRRMKPDEKKVSKVKYELGIDFAGSVRQLSVGMRVRVALATAFMASPKVILVDEAFSNLHEKQDFVASYRKLVGDEGIDLIFSSPDEADGRLSDHLYVISNGTTTRQQSAW
ncbi:MAG TPA: ATP-binding cassette domain-containing protein [Nitrososphaerales archaeon]|nr:ATP-binding cassette domain-containing protein [Nitrososphaerales archaeon]